MASAKPQRVRRHDEEHWGEQGSPQAAERMLVNPFARVKQSQQAETCLVGRTGLRCPPSSQCRATGPRLHIRSYCTVGGIERLCRVQRSQWSVAMGLGVGSRSSLPGPSIQFAFPETLSVSRAGWPLAKSAPRGVLQSNDTPLGLSASLGRELGFVGRWLPL